jgi:O-methyltransferase
MTSAAPVERPLSRHESTGPTSERPIRSRYLELMKKTLTDEIYADVRPGHEIRSGRGREPRTLARNLVVALLARGGFTLVRRSSAERRLGGTIVPLSAHTMIGRARLDHLQRCAETVLDSGVPGDFVEAGVWRGGASILMRAVLAARGVTDRCVWLADSFMGLPPPNAEAFPADRGSWLHEDQTFSVGLNEVRKNFAAYDLLDEQVRFVPGWFKDTLADAPIERIALLRLDADLYESTWQALTGLHHRVSPGGVVVVDDYRSMAGCRRAVDDFRERNGIDDEIHEIANAADGVYWRRPTSVDGHEQ